MKPSNFVWKAGSGEETMANNEGDVLQVAVWRERKANAMRESYNSRRRILKHDWNLSAMSKKAAYLNKICMAHFHSNRYTAIKKKQLIPIKPCILCSSVSAEYSPSARGGEWEGQLWQGFLKVLHSRSTHSPSFLLCMFGLKVTSNLTLNSTNNYNKYLYLSSIHLCTQITNSFLCCLWRPFHCSMAKEKENLLKSK